MTLPKEGFSVTVIISLQDDASNDSRYKNYNDTMLCMKKKKKKKERVRKLKTTEIKTDPKSFGLRLKWRSSEFRGILQTVS